MNKQEYLQELVVKYNANPNDETLSEVEKVLLTKVAEAEKNLNTLLQQATDLEKELSAKSQSLSDLRATMVREKGKSDAFVEALVALKK